MFSVSMRMRRTETEIRLCGCYLRRRQSSDLNVIYQCPPRVPPAPHVLAYCARMLWRHRHSTLPCLHSTAAEIIYQPEVCWKTQDVFNVSYEVRWSCEQPCWAYCLYVWYLKQKQIREDLQNVVMRECVNGSTNAVFDCLDEGAEERNI
jgi:hypothetical protein